MASNRIFNSSFDWQIWVDQITPILSNPQRFPASPSTCSIFVVPKTLSAVNPEAYTPRVIGMGPYHHLRPDLYAGETYKLIVAKILLKRIPTIEVQHLVAKLKELDSEIRASYNEYLDLPPDILALIIAIDGLLLLAILKQSHNDVTFEDVRVVSDEDVGDLGDEDVGDLADGDVEQRLDDPEAIRCLLLAIASAAKLEMHDIHGDLFMLENQIPIDLLGRIFNPSDGHNYSSSAGADQLDPQDVESGEEMLLFPTIFVDFCKEHCPLEFDEQRASYLAGNCKHLLDLMYYSIVDFHGLEYPREAEPLMGAGRPPPEDIAVLLECLAPIFHVLPYGEQIIGLLQSLLQIIQGMPWDRIFLLFRKLKEDNAKSKSQAIKIPSASQLSSVGVKINLTTKIAEIRFDEKEATLFLPLITLNVTSKVVLRNLVAYEASIAIPRAMCELALYAFLMSGIISAAEDVELLKAKGVVKVKGRLSNGEIADIFGGMCKPSTQPYEKSRLEETIEIVDKFYNGKWKVKACKFARASWRVLKTVFTVLVISAICLKLICNAFDCPRISWKSPSADLDLPLQIQ